jgi:nitroreductase
MNIIDHYNWRYATKKFNPNKFLAESDLELIKEAIRLAPTSYGLQLFKVIIVKDEKLKARLKEVSFNQSQISESSHLFIFCNYTKVFEKDIDLYLNIRSKIQSQTLDELEGYGSFLKRSLLNKNKAELVTWTTNQVYIALAHLMTACATLQIDTCPIEGFDVEKYNEILDLNDRHMSAAVIAAVGYRSNKDKSQNDEKVRKSSKILFEII